jgi:integrase
LLSEPTVRRAKGQDRPYKLTDSHGLYLYVTPAGTRIWRVRYDLDGKEQTLTVGHYPEVGLAEARAARDRAREAKQAGRNPALVRKPTAVTFEDVARAWQEQHQARWKPIHARDVIHTLERDIFPTLGGVAIATITAPEVLHVLRQIERRGAIETAHRVRQRVSAVFVHAIASGLCETDPAAIVKPALKRAVRSKQAAIIDVAGIRAVLAAADAVPAQPTTRLGLRLIALTAVRGGELRGADRSEFERLDGAEPLWRIPAERTKMGREHQVPLSRQAVETVQCALTLAGRGRLLFPSVRHAHRPMSENVIGHLLNQAGYQGQHVPHGFRSAFSTIMNERHRADRAVIDLMLAHSPKDTVESAYNRALHMERRRELAQVWADLLLHGAMPLERLMGLPRR